MALYCARQPALLPRENRHHHQEKKKLRVQVKDCSSTAAGAGNLKETLAKFAFKIDLRN
jgi:hypothetical protein